MTALAQTDLFAHHCAAPRAMGRQLRAVHDAMQYGRWLTFAEIRACIPVGISGEGVSARIRDLRKAEYGSHTIERRATDRKGIFEYRMTP